MVSKREIDKGVMRQYSESLAKKIKQENKFHKELSAHFKKFTKETFGHYAKNGHVPSNISHHRNDVEKMIHANYLGTSSKFKNSVRDILGNPKNNANIDKRLDSIITHRAQNQSHKAANIISETTRSQVDKSIKKVLAEDAAEGKIMSHASVAKRAALNFSLKSEARTNSIVVTETQIAAETTKFDEINLLTDVDAVFEDDTKFNDFKKTKQWIATLDDKTREAHVEADGQEVNMDEAYDVGGEELMFPGDDSLGASEDNIINCRCASEFAFDTGD